MPPNEDNSHYEKILATGVVKCIDDEIPFELPKSWEWVRVRDISQSYIGLTYAPTDVSEKGIIVLRSSNIKDGKLDLTDIVRVNKEVNEKLQVNINDIIICARNGSRKLVGKSAIITEKKEHMTFGAFMAICKTKFYNYIYLFLQSDSFFSQLRKVSGTTTINQLTQNNFNNFLVPIPPQNEQARIFDKYNELLPIIEKYGKSEELLNRLNTELYSNLKKSILQEAIQGKLVPQDSNDEPATVLLEKINSEKLRLVQEGKLKKKDLTDSTIFKGDDNKYYQQIDGKTIEIDSDFEFPNTWSVVRLSDICRLIDGEKKQGQYVCLDAKYLRGKSTGDKLNNGKFVSKGDNIILVDGENSGEVFTVPCDGYMGSTFKQLWVSREMYLPYVLYFIQFYKDRLRNSKKGAAIPHLNKEIFYNLWVGIPPKDEQMRISAKVADLYSNL